MQIIAQNILSGVYKECIGLVASNKGKLGAGDKNVNEDFFLYNSVDKLSI